MFSSTPSQIDRKSYSTAHRVVLFFFLIVGLVIYSNTFAVEAQLDDVHIFAGVTMDNLLSRCTLNNTRLVADLSFAFNYWLAGPKVLGYHIFNLIVHVFTAFLVYHLLLLTLELTAGGRNTARTVSAKHLDIPALPQLSDHIFWGGFVGGLIFLVHPLATQAVTYITQRYTSLATLFYVASIVCYLKARLFMSNGPAAGYATSPQNSFFTRRHLAWYALAVVSAILAMYTKEMCVTLPVMLVLIEFVFLQCGVQHIGQRILYLMPLLLTGLIIPYHHLPPVDVLSASSSTAVAEILAEPSQLLPRWAEEQYLSRQTYLFSQIGIIWTIYLKLLVWPWGQNIEHDFFVSDGLFNATTFVAFIGVLSLLVTAILIFRKNRIFGLGILWFFITLSVTSTIIPNTIFVAEHRVYLPMIGLALVVAGIYRHLKRPRFFLTAAVPLMLTLSVLTFVRNSVWKDGLTLWGDALEKSPDMCRPYNNYALALQGTGKLDEAISLYHEALSLPTVYYKSDLSHKLVVLANLGTAYAAKGMYKEALDSYQAAARFTAPGYRYNIYYNMGNLYKEQKQYTKAAEAYVKAVQVNPQNYRAYTNLGVTLMSLNSEDEAEAALKHALRNNGAAAEAHLNLGKLYSKDSTKRHKALAHYRMYLALRPDSQLGDSVLANIRRLEGEVRGQGSEVRSQESGTWIQETGSKMKDAGSR